MNLTHNSASRPEYCKDGNRRDSAEHTSFTFLGFTFRPRQARRKDGAVHLVPAAISKDALKKISAEVRSWRLHRWAGSDGPEIARLVNPKVRGWAYYGAFCQSAPARLRLLHDFSRTIGLPAGKHSGSSYEISAVRRM
jgi:RNA-directed DNA polymerase